LGEELDVVINGNGFDADTRVSYKLDIGNSRLIKGTFHTPTGFDDANGLPEDIVIVGNTAYITDLYSRFHVVDISTATPQILSSVDLPLTAKNLAVVGDKLYLSMSDGGLKIFDISNSANPTSLGEIDTPGISYEVVVSGELAYIAAGTAGLQIVDVYPVSPLRSRSFVVLVLFHRAHLDLLLLRASCSLHYRLSCASCLAEFCRIWSSAVGR